MLTKTVAKSNETDYNELAGKIKPNDKSYINNFKYFKTLGFHKN